MSMCCDKHSDPRPTDPRCCHSSAGDVRGAQVRPVVTDNKDQKPDKGTKGQICKTRVTGVSIMSTAGHCPYISVPVL
jgi:hypothetical protein